MIKLIGDNDVFEAIKLMDKSTKGKEHLGYERNESIWIQYFTSLVEKQKESQTIRIALSQNRIKTDTSG